METGLYQKYRPTRFKEVVGQNAAVGVLRSLLAAQTFPPAVLFSGPSGVGKTTLARILSKKLGCIESADLFEVNCADFRGIDSVRDIRSRVGAMPLSGGECRIWLIDEAHQMTADAQDAILKTLEDAPPHRHFFLASTHPQKLKPTIRTRCVPVDLKPVKTPELRVLVGQTAEMEGISLGGDVVERIAEYAEGSPRKALVLLESILHMDGETQQLEALRKSDVESQGIELCRLLLADKTSWGEVASVLRSLEGDAESIRHAVLGYANAVLLKEGQSPARMARAYGVLAVFRYDTFTSGRPGLSAACWEVIAARK